MRYATYYPFHHSMEGRHVCTELVSFLSHDDLLDDDILIGVFSLRRADDYYILLIVQADDIPCSFVSCDPAALYMARRLRYVLSWRYRGPRGVLARSWCLRAVALAYGRS